MKKGDVIRQKCVNTTFYLTGLLAHKVNNKSCTTETIKSIDTMCDCPTEPIKP